MTIIRMTTLRLTLLCCTLLPAFVHAFKIDTHLWLAAHLLEEIEAGVVRFPDGVEIPLQPQISSAISAHPNAFLIGVLGPDLYPDLAAGQMTTHPGLPPLLEANPDSVPTNVAAMAQSFGRPITGSVRGWQTDDWLHFVRTEAFRVSGDRPTAEVAFAMGYLLHAAMDTWAHTYVNLYTGDLFSIVENQEIAARHTALENFIKGTHEKYVKPASGSSAQAGKTGRAASAFARAPEDNLAAHAAPTKFVRETLLLNGWAANQYARTPGAQHIFAMWLVWDNAKRAAGGWQNVRGSVDQLVDQAQSAVFNANQAWQTAEQAKSLAASALAAALQTKANAESAAATAGNTLANTIQGLLDFLEDNANIQATVATVEDFLGWLPAPMRTGYQQAKQAALNADKALRDAVDAWETAAEQSNEAASMALAALEELQLKQTAHQAAQTARQTLWTAVDTGLDGWRRNIEAGTDAYVRAFEETAREIMRGSGDRFRRGASPTEPLKSWATCWGPLFGMPALPVPPRTLAATCQQGLEAYGHARESLTLLKNNLAFDALGLGHLKQPIVDFEEQLHESVRDGLPIAGQLIGEAVGPGAELIPGSASFMAQLWDHDVSADDLNAEFSADGSNRNLPLYSSNKNNADSVSARLLQDGLPSGTGKDIRTMSEFPPIHNALMLSRLTLLDGAGLNALAGRFGVTSSAYADGKPAYPDNAPVGSVLVGAIRSIDGNHQWQPVAPRLPRHNPAVAADNAAEAECRRFGYPANGNYGSQGCPKDAAAAGVPGLADWLEDKHGFRLWFDPELRQRVFDRLFIGPLSIAVCGKLGPVASEHAGMGCGDSEPYPPSEASAQSVALFTSSGSRRVADRLPPRTDPRTTRVPAKTHAASGSKEASLPARRAPSRQSVATPAPSRSPSVATKAQTVDPKSEATKATTTAEPTRTSDPKTRSTLQVTPTLPDPRRN